MRRPNFGDKAQRSAIAAAKKENTRQKTEMIMIGNQDVEMVNEEVAHEAPAAPNDFLIENECESEDDSGIESEDDEFDEEFVDTMMISEGVM